MVRVGAFGLADGLRSRIAAVWLCVALGAAGLAAVAQDAQDDKVPTLHAYTNLVQVPVLVLDGDRKPMAPIAERRFFVSLDGGPKFRVTHARLEGEDPITLAIVLDVRQPSPRLMAKFDDALAALAPLSLNPKDHVSIYSLDCSLTRIALDAPADAETLKRGVDLALQIWKMSGQDRRKGKCRNAFNLWDTLASVAQALGRQQGRRVILVVTDGVDRGSRTTWNELREYAQQRGVAIFGLVQPSDVFPGPEKDFNGLCELSGGMVMTATEKNLPDQLKRFTSMVRGRYIVEFPRPMTTIGGTHDMYITIEKAEAFVRPAGISIPVDDPAILNDPTTVPSDPSRAPQLGKRKVITH